MENYEKNGLPEYIGAVVALTALLMGYCTFLRWQTVMCLRQSGQLNMLPR